MSSRSGARCLSVVALTVGALLLTACGTATPGNPGASASNAVVKLPGVMNFASLDVGSANYLVHTAIAHAVSGREKNTIRIIPSGSDVARNSMLAQHRVDFGVFGAATTFEGLTLMASGPDLGPQPLRYAAVNFPDTNTLTACAADIFPDKGASAKTPMDIPKGTRFNFIENSFGFNNSNEAWIAYGGHAKDDMKWIPVPSHGQSAATIIAGRSDCFWTATNTAQNEDLANSPRGYVPITLHKDAPTTQPDAWKRLKAVNPLSVYGVATEGVRPVSKEKPNFGNNASFASVETSAKVDANLVYAFTKAIYESYGDFKDSVPGVSGFQPKQALDRLKDSFVPYHEGMVRYLKEKDLWTADAEAYNQSLIRREQTLQRAWDRMIAEAAAKNVQKAEEFEDMWMKIRGEELKKDGLDVYFETVYWRSKK